MSKVRQEMDTWFKKFESRQSEMRQRQNDMRQQQDGIKQPQASIKNQQDELIAEVRAISTAVGHSRTRCMTTGKT